jgi:hypothetical protein
MPPKTRNQATAEETKASGEDGKRLAEASEKKGKKRKVSKKNLEQQSKKQKQEEEAAKKKQEEAAAKKAQESNSTVPMSDVDDDEEMNRAAEESLKTAAAETGPRLNREELEEKKRIDKVVSEAEKKQWDASDWERFRTDLFRLLRLSKIAKDEDKLRVLFAVVLPEQYDRLEGAKTFEQALDTLKAKFATPQEQTKAIMQISDWTWQPGQSVTAAYG